MEAILGMPLPPTALPKGVTMVTLILFYVKSPDAKTGVTSHLSVDEYGTTNASNFKCGITSGSDPKRG